MEERGQNVNKMRLRILWAGTALIALMAVFPPWACIRTQYQAASSVYGLILKPPAGECDDRSVIDDFEACSSVDFSRHFNSLLDYHLQFSRGHP